MRNELIKKYSKWLKGESFEQANFALWLESNGYLFTSIPNSTFTKSFKQRTMNYILGLNPGLCDMLIILKRGSLLFVEMKREKGKRGGMNGSVIGEDQAKWVNALDAIDNVSAVFCHGAKEAIEKVQFYESL